MQALVLAGGQGTRLRPLTLTVPKPVMPLAGRPFLSFMLDWLRGHGVDDVVLSCGFLGEGVERVLGAEHAGMRLRYVNEDEPLGTAGPVRLALDEGALTGDRLLVLNGDVLTDMDLTAELEQHTRTGAAATLALIAVEDTSSYGVVPTAADNAVEAFLEKAPPGSGPPPSDQVNAGAYVLERSVIETIPAGRPVSFEREVFPGLVGAGLYGWTTNAAYWVDIGTPERYLEATYDLLAGRVESALPPRDAGDSLVWPGAQVEGAHIGPLTVISEDCTLAPGAVAEHAVLHRGVSVAADARISGAVLADGVTVGAGARVERGALVGSGAVIEPGALVAAGARLDPAERAA